MTIFHSKPLRTIHTTPLEVPYYAHNVQRFPRDMGADRHFSEASLATLHALPPAYIREHKRARAHSNSAVQVVQLWKFVSFSYSGRAVFIGDATTSTKRFPSPCLQSTVSAKREPVSLCLMSPSFPGNIYKWPARIDKDAPSEGAFERAWCNREDVLSLCYMRPG